MTADFLTVGFDTTLTPADDSRPQYPTIQWSHNPGGWLLPCDRAEEFDVTLPWERRTVRLGSNEVPCYYSASAEVAILAQVKRWFVTDEDGRLRYLEHYEQGARSKSHVMVLVKDAPAVPFVLSFKGMTSADIGGQLGKLTSAMKRGNVLRPLYFFWLKLSAGPAQRLKQGAVVAPALVDLPGKDDDLVEWLKARFTGADFVADVEAVFGDEIREFAQSLQRTTDNSDEAPNGNGHSNGNGHDGDDFDAMPSATGDRAVALALSKKWDHTDAVAWAVDLGAYASIDEGKQDYSWLWNQTKAARGGRVPQYQDWFPVWIDHTLASSVEAGAVEEPLF